MHYRLNRIIGPATGYLAVWSYPKDCKDPSSPVEVCVERIEFFAETEEMEIGTDHQWLVHEGASWLQVVGVQLMQGCFEIINEARNFHGFVTADAEWNAILELIPEEERARAVKWEPKT